MPRKSAKSKNKMVDESESASINQLSADLSNIDLNSASICYNFIDKSTICRPFRKFLYQIKDYYCEYHEIDAEYQQNVESTIGHFMVERFYSSENEMSAEIMKITNAYRHHMWGVIDIIVEKYMASRNYKVIYYFSFYHQDDDLYISKIQTLVENAFVL